jgi:hypothetical protein
MRRPEADPPPALDPSARTRRQDTVRTGCGREFVVGDFCLDQLARPAARVSLSTRRLPQDRDELWASFTPDEARRLAARLLAHAAEADAAALAMPDARPPETG